MRRTMVILAALALALAPATLAADQWFHVRVERKGEDAELVSVNLPLSMIEKVLPAIEDEHIKGGKVRLDLDDKLHAHGVDLREIWSGLKDSPDGNFVTVKSQDENVKVRKANGYLLVDVDSQEGDEPEKVQIRLPMRVLDAAFSSPEQELDLVALLKALADHGEEELVSVNDGETVVRIWIDSKME